jgi:hypothetical protein
MSALGNAIDQVKGQLNSLVVSIKRQVFGANNERLDFFMDSFYKLSPQQRMGVLAGVGGVVGLFVFLALMLYFAQVAKLRDDLNEGFAAMHEIKRLRLAYEVENKNYEKLVETVQRKSKQVSLKPFFEKIANDLGVTIEGINDQKVPLAADNPLNEKLQEVRVEMRLPNISIPKLLNFIVEIEKSGKYLKIQDLQIRARYGTKLFFDGQIKVRGYDVSS